MSYTVSLDKLPKDVQHDLDNGFVLSDIDDRFQRYLKINDHTFNYRSGTNDQDFLCTLEISDREKLEEVISQEIDVESLSDGEIQDAISGYYESTDAMFDEFDAETTYLLIAECYFESEVDHIR